MTRLEACYQVAMEVCKARRGCAWRHAQSEYACRDYLVEGCCRVDETCDQEVTVSTAWLSACFRELEVEYDCNRLYTPACQRVVPGAKDEVPPSSTP